MNLSHLSCRHLMGRCARRWRGLIPQKVNQNALDAFKVASCACRQPHTNHSHSVWKSFSYLARWTTLLSQLHIWWLRSSSYQFMRRHQRLRYEVNMKHTMTLPHCRTLCVNLIRNFLAFPHTRTGEFHGLATLNSQPK